MLTAKELQTCVGQLLAAKMHMFTLKVQAIDGERGRLLTTFLAGCWLTTDLLAGVYWRSDDAFKRCAKTRGGAVLDHT